MDETQLTHFLDCLVGWKPLGVAGNEEIAVPVCGEMRAFLTGQLGDKMPRYTWEAMKMQDKAMALATLLADAAQCLFQRHTKN